MLRPLQDPSFTELSGTRFSAGTFWQVLRQGAMVQPER